MTLLACPCLVTSNTNSFTKLAFHTKTLLNLRGGSNNAPGSNIISSRFSTTTSSRYSNSKTVQNNQNNYPIVEEISNEENNAKEVINSFLSRENRNSFIIKVYSILTVQLLVTCLFIFGFHSFSNVSYWMMTKGRFIPLLSLFMSSICCTIMTTSVRARRTSPLKWQLLTLFTLGECIAVGFISSFYKWATVVSAMSATAFASGGVTLYTFLQKNPKYDLSQWGAALSS